MAKFNVSIETTIQVVCSVEVSAKDGEAAEAKVQAMIDKGKFAIHWEAAKSADPSIDFEETDNQTAIESCDEA